MFENPNYASDMGMIMPEDTPAPSFSKFLAGNMALNVENGTVKVEVIESQIIPGKKDAPALWGHSATYWKGRIVIFGGRDSSHKEQNKIHIYDVRRNLWQTPKIIGKCPPPTSSHTATLANDN